MSVVEQGVSLDELIANATAQLSAFYGAEGWVLTNIEARPLTFAVGGNPEAWEIEVHAKPLWPSTV